MNSRKKLLRKSRLYLILDKKTFADMPFPVLVNKTCRAGVNIIQFRDKESKKEEILRDALLLHKLLLGRKALFIINDYLDIAKIVDSDGVHLGQDDTSIELARRILGKDKIIGISCHNLKQALQAQKKGADYIGFGPIFSTPTKPEYGKIGLDSIGCLKKKIRIPIFAIGGINKDNLAGVISAGVRRAAICRGILKSVNIAQSAEYFSRALR